MIFRNKSAHGTRVSSGPANEFAGCPGAQTPCGDSPGSPQSAARKAAITFQRRRTWGLSRRGVSRRLALPALCLALLPSAGAQAPQKPADTTPRLGEVRIDRYRELVWRPEDNYFRSPGPVRIILVDADTGQETTLIADDAEAVPVRDAAGNPTGEFDIVVKGRMRLERAEGVLTGRALTYRAQTQTGEVNAAQARLQNLIVTGEKITLLPGRIALATGASFTTCEKPRPDYHITAREVRIRSDGKVRAKGITFWIGRTRILSLPSFERSFNRTVSNPIPLPGFSKEFGIQMRFSDDLRSEPSTLFQYSILLSLRRTPQGIVSYERDLGTTPPNAAPPRSHAPLLAEPLRSALEANPALLAGAEEARETQRRSTWYALLANRVNVYNRKRTDLRVSRLPEIGISYRNLLNRHDPFDDPAAPQPPAESAFGRALLDPARWLLNADASLGYLQERPTDVDRWRLGLRAEATGPLLRVTGPLYFRYGGTAWGSLYGGGDGYTLLAPEAEIAYLPRRNTLIGAAYRYMQEFGTTPFQFDRRDVRHELRLRYGFLGASWAYDLGVNYDMERKRAYDTTVGIRRRFDCMEVGLAYRTRSQGFSLILNLLPGAPNKAAGSSSEEPGAKE